MVLLWWKRVALLLETNRSDGFANAECVCVKRAGFRSYI
jgi:hypothetical protein